MFPISRNIITTWAGEKMNKDEILKKMNNTVNDTKKVLDSYEVIAKLLYTFYDNLINNGFNEEQAFMLTQQYFDRMSREFF